PRGPSFPLRPSATSTRQGSVWTGAWRFADGPAELVKCAFGFAHQDVSGAIQFVSSLHQQLGRLTSELCFPTDLRWEHRAGVEMRPDAVNQIRVAPLASERANAELIDRSDLAQAELHLARCAVANLMVLAVDED